VISVTGFNTTEYDFFYDFTVAYFLGPSYMTQNKRRYAPLMFILSRLNVEKYKSYVA